MLQSRKVSTRMLARKSERKATDEGGAPSHPQGAGGEVKIHAEEWIKGALLQGLWEYASD